MFFLHETATNWEFASLSFLILCPHLSASLISSFIALVSVHLWISTALSLCGCGFGFFFYFVYFGLHLSLSLCFRVCSPPSQSSPCLSLTYTVMFIPLRSFLMIPKKPVLGLLSHQNWD